MSSPDTINRALSERIGEVMDSEFPNAKKSGASWKMGDMDGSTGGSCGVFRGRGGIYIAKDAATDESTNILGLLHRKWGGTWAETLSKAKKICNLNDVKSVAPNPKPPKPRLHQSSMRGTAPYEYLLSRGIQEKTMQKYGLRRIDRKHLPPTKQLRWNEEYVIFPYVDTEGDTVMYKWLGVERKDGKKEIGSTYPQYATLWGWGLVDDNTKECLICEGEIDALSIEQMHPDIPALSVPAGTNDLAWIDNDYERLQQFETIYLLTDMDKAGEKAAQAIAKRLGLTRCHRVSLPEGYNDSNEFLQSNEHGKPKFVELLASAKTYDPKQLKAANEMRFGLEERIERFNIEQQSNPFLWPELPFRYRRGEMTVITGFPSHGKSQFLYQSVLHEMIANDRRVCIASFEIPADDMLFNLLWMLHGRCPSIENLEAQLQVFQDRLWFIEGEDSAQDWNGLKQDFDYAAKRFGCDVFVVDALMHITKKGDAEGTDRVAKSSAKWSKDNDLTTLLVAHADAKKRRSGDEVPEVEDILGGARYWRGRSQCHFHLAQSAEAKERGGG